MVSVTMWSNSCLSQILLGCLSFAALATTTTSAFCSMPAREGHSASLLNSVSATGDYFSNLGTTNRHSGGLPDFSQMKAPQSPVPLVSIEGDEFWGGFVDEAAALEKWEFPFTPAQLVLMAKGFYHPDVLIGLADGGACLADDFEFCGSTFGPVGKEEYLQALTRFGLDKSFEIVGNIYGFYADPLQPGRVWYFNRSRAKQVAPFLGVAPRNKEIEFPPQMNFLDFDMNGKVQQHGFYTIDRRQGNTGGLGGGYGYMYAVGRAPPFPEAQPFRPSFRLQAFNLVLRIFYKFKKYKASKQSVAKIINGSVNGKH